MIQRLAVLGLAVTLIGCAGCAGPSPAPVTSAAHAGAVQQIVYPFPAEATEDEDLLAASMPELARRLIASYHEEDQQAYLKRLFRFQLIAGDPAGALSTLDTLRNLHPTASASSDPAQVVYEIYATAKKRASNDGQNFSEAYGEAFRDVYARLNNLEAQDITFWLKTPGSLWERRLREALKPTGSDGRIGQTEAVKLVRAWLAHRMYIKTKPYLPEVIAAEQARRYVINDKVLIHTPEGATVSAIIVRPRSARGPLPTVLRFTIYAEPAACRQLAILAAAHGYVGVVAFVRGKYLSPDKIVPYGHEVGDTYAVIDWISRQPWSNSEVGMVGGSFGGFAAWAATKRLNPALKTIVTYAAAIPGLGLPMYNNVFLNANYAWTFYVTNNKLLDYDTYSEYRQGRGEALFKNWYASGRPYREIPQIDGTPNPLFQRWLDHPAYDAYWQAMVPYQEDYAHINIPVLTLTGYYDDAQISALHYFNEHYKYNENAEHYLVIGPYGHFTVQARRKPHKFHGYTLDPVAHFDTQELTFQWLDYVLRGGRKPALLKDRINFQVMGANIWRHVPSLDAMGNETLKLYLTAKAAGTKYYQLSKGAPESAKALKQVLNFTDRSISHGDYYPHPVKGKKADFTGLAFISKPFEEPVQVNGMFSGNLKVTINKRDFDFYVVLYEVMPVGTLFQLSYYLGA